MNGVVARRNNFNEYILPMLENAYAEFGQLTGRHYGLIHEYKTEDADTVFVSLGCAADNIEAACDYIRDQRAGKVAQFKLKLFGRSPKPLLLMRCVARKKATTLSAPTKASAGATPWAR